MTRERLSVVIPMHQGGKTISGTLDSLIDQPGVDIEVIVVDDRSSDDGPARALAHQINARVIAADGIGRSAARNTGFRHATGDALLFLDADDLLLPNALAPRLRTLDAAGTGAVAVSRYRQRLEGRTRARPVLPDVASTGDSNGDPRLAFLRRNQAPIHCCTLRRAELLLWVGDAPFPVGQHAMEDWDLWLRLAFRGARFVRHDAEDCEYVLRSGMTNTVVDSATDALSVLERAARLVDSTTESPQWHARAAHQLRTARLEYHLWRAVMWGRTRYPLRAAVDVARGLIQGGDAVTEIPDLATIWFSDRKWRRGEPP